MAAVRIDDHEHEADIFRAQLMRSSLRGPRVGELAAALVLTTLVALGSTSHVRAGDLSTSYSQFGLFGMAAAALALAFVGLWLGGYVSLAGRRRGTKLLAVMIAALLVTSMASSLFRPYRPQGSGYSCPSCGSGGNPQGGGKPLGQKGGGGGLAFAGVLAGGSLLAAFFLVGVGLLLAARRQPVVEEERLVRAGHERLPEPLVEAVDESLDDLRSERDVRRAVIACYARMENALARSGAARRLHEAPFEFLARVLERIARDPGRVLTELFERAKFSVEPMGTTEKEQAVAALELLRSAAFASPAEAPKR